MLYQATPFTLFIPHPYNACTPPIHHYIILAILRLLLKTFVQGNPFKEPSDVVFDANGLSGCKIEIVNVPLTSLNIFQNGTFIIITIIIVSYKI